MSLSGLLPCLFRLVATDNDAAEHPRLASLNASSYSGMRGSVEVTDGVLTMLCIRTVPINVVPETWNTRKQPSDVAGRLSQSSGEGICPVRASSIAAMPRNARSRWLWQSNPMWTWPVLPARQAARLAHGRKHISDLARVASCRGRPLRGVLFWRWDLQVYAGTDPADYGVQVQDTTFDIIKENADQQKVLSAQQPPNAACRVGCWVPEVHAGTFSTVNRCAQRSFDVVCTLQEPYNPLATPSWPCTCP